MSVAKIYWVPGRSYTENGIQYILIRTVARARWFAAVLKQEERDEFADLIHNGVGYSVGINEEAPQPGSKARESPEMIERLNAFLDEIDENDGEDNEEEEEEQEEGKEEEEKKDEKEEGKKDGKKDEEKGQQEEPRRHQI